MTKKELIEAGKTLEADYSGNYTAYASKNEFDFNGEGVIGGDFGISYHQGAMPAIGSDTLKIVDELLAQMVKIAPLTKWRISRPE